MNLFIDGREIKEFTVGDIETNEYKKYSAEPHEQLKCLDEFLEGCGKSIDSVEELHIIKGKGSATALRTSLAIVNTIQFVKHIPVYTYVYEQGVPCFEEIVSGNARGELATGYVTPEYAYAPRVTPTKRDQLNRKQ